MQQKLIVIDGKTYNSVEEMPEDVRRNYENAIRNSGGNSNGNPNPAANPFEHTTANVFSANRIVVNGKVYNSIDELPPDIRAKYEQATNTLKDGNQNNIPDIFENVPMTSVMSDGMKLIVNGQMLNSLNDLPPEARAKYEQAMGALDANKNGIPDFVEGMFVAPRQSNQAEVGYGIQSPRPALSKPIPVPSTIEPESSGGWMLILIGILLAGLCVIAGAAGIWYFYLR